MINTFFIVGDVKKISVTKPNDPKKNASAVMMVQYGVKRESTGSSVDFVNAVLIRVPSYKYPKLKDKLVEGSKVQITGHLQGVLKSGEIQSSFLATELVADRIDIVGQPEETPEE